MASLPKTYRKLVVRKMTTDFRAAVAIETTVMCKPQEGEICVKTRYVGINATDINITKGRYFVGAKVPFDVGNEGIGEVVQVGPGVTDIKVGDVVAYVSSKRNAYAEYCCMPATNALIVPGAKPEYLVVLISGLTAAIGLDKGTLITSKETVLITAAAGGTGHIAVQWAKAADCHVIGTCSSADKEKVLKDLGCDRVINYKKEDIGEVLAKEYPRGIDVIWETIGGQVFETCVKNLAVKGRLLIVGGITGYKEENKEALPKTEFCSLPDMLLYRSATIQGFLIGHYRKCYPAYFKYLLECVNSGKIRPIYDLGKNDEFTGLESIVNGVEYLHTGKSIGKVMAKIS